MKNALVLLLTGVALVACGGKDAPSKTTNDTPTCTPNNVLQTVVNAMSLPTATTDGFDIDGDGIVDDRFAFITHAFETQGFDTQQAVSNAIASGVAPLLIAIDSSDATFANDTCTEVSLQIAAALPGITFNGSDALTPASTAATIGGTITNNVFTSDAPAAKPAPINVTVGFGVAVAPVPLNAVHLQLAVDATAHTLTGGRLGGAILVTDMNNVLFPVLATQLTAQIAAGGANATLVSGIFDTGGATSVGCTTTCLDALTSQCAEPADGIVMTCEITTNGLLEAVLAPDVAILDANGNIAPDHMRTPKDALSFAVNFTAVGATY